MTDQLPSPKNARRQLKRLLDKKFRRDFAIKKLANDWGVTPTDATAWMKQKKRGRQTEPKEEPIMAERRQACLVSREELLETIKALVDDGMTLAQAKVGTAKFYRLSMASLNGMIHVEPAGCPSPEEVWAKAATIRATWSDGVAMRRAGIRRVCLDTEVVRLRDCG